MEDFKPEPVEGEVWTVPQAANELNVGEHRILRVIVGDMITPIRTRNGIGYLSEDIKAAFARRGIHYPE